MLIDGTYLYKFVDEIDTLRIVLITYQIEVIQKGRYFATFVTRIFQICFENLETIAI